MYDNKISNQGSALWNVFCWTYKNKTLNANVHELFFYSSLTYFPRFFFRENLALYKNEKHKLFIVVYCRLGPASKSVLLFCYWNFFIAQQKSRETISTTIFIMCRAKNIFRIFSLVYFAEEAKKVALNFQNPSPHYFLTHTGMLHYLNHVHTHILLFKLFYLPMNSNYHYRVLSYCKIDSFTTFLYLFFAFPL